jgi:hypothetical protein
VQAKVHAAPSIREHAIAKQALSQAGDILFRIVTVYGDQDKESAAYFADNLPSHGDLCVGNPL